MLGSDFITNYRKYQALSLFGVKDFADQLNYLYTTVILIICTTVVTAKTYVLKPLACHVPTVPSGAKFGKYFESYCWITGSIPFRSDEDLPDEEDIWNEWSEDRKILYYQWIPFMMGLQTILFLVPFLFWRNISFNRLGTDVTAIIMKAMDALKTTAPAAREKKVNNVAYRLELLLFAHREVRHSRMTDFRRTLSGLLGVLFASKRMGTWIVSAYLFTKILFLVNALGQLFLIKRFLAVNESMAAFCVQVIRSLLHGSDWRSTLFFPRMSYCQVKLRHLGASNNRFMGMCVLTINMLAEKIYIFLWIWILVVAVVTAWSLVSWIVRLHIRRHQAGVVRKYLKLAPLQPKDESAEATPKSVSWQDGSAADPKDPANVDRFITEFLRLDGVFIIQMLTLNAGDVITGEVIRLLWRAWLDRYTGRNFKNDPWENYEYPPPPPPPESKEELELIDRPSE